MKISMLQGLAAGLVALFMATTVQAGEVTVTGAHLCCGACVRDVGKALSDVDGVSDASCDRENATISFQAANDEAATRGIKALADAGFHGKAKHGDKALEFPASGAKKGDKADTVTVTGVHLCCGGCVNAAKKAVSGISTDVEVDRDTTTVTVKGSQLDVAAVVAALNEAGFHATVKK